jgi:small-conductance mechanosensitive channel
VNHAWRIDWNYIRTLLLPDLDSAVVRRLLLTVAVLAVLYIFRFLARHLIGPMLKSRHAKYYWGKAGVYLMLVGGGWCMVCIWFAGVGSLVTVLGLFSAGMAIALKDPLVNLAGFLAILIRRPFRIGQRVQIGEQAGDVVDIRSLHFTLLEVGKWVRGEQSTGRLVHIPNGLIFTMPLINYQGGFDYLWNELTLVLPPGTDFNSARSKLLEIVTRHAETDESSVRREIDSLSGEIMIRYQNLSPIVYLAVQDGKALLTARYLCHTRQRRVTESHIWEELLIAFPSIVES